MRNRFNCNLVVMGEAQPLPKSRLRTTSMRRFRIFVMVVVVLLLTQKQVQGVDRDKHKHEPRISEMSARLLMREIDHAYRTSTLAYRHYADETFSPDILMREKFRNFYEEMKRYDWHRFKDPILRRQFEVILRGAKYPPINYQFKKATHTLKEMSRQKWVCSKDMPNQCNFAFVHQIKTIFAHSEDPDEIKYYWQEWRNKMPEEVKNALHYYIAYYQNLSTPEISPAAAWYDQYEDANFINELEAAMTAILPFYREMHAHLRHVLRLQYGENIIPSSGLIPHHLYEQVTYQVWKKSSVLRNPIIDRSLPNLQAELDRSEFTPFDMVNISVNFFSSMGVNYIDEQFMREKVKEMEPGTGGPDCKSRIFEFGQIGLDYCPKVYFKKLLQTHGDVSQVEYALARNKLLVGTNQKACPGFGSALGEAVILSASTPRYLKDRLKLLQNYEYDDYLNLNRLYRMAVHTLLTLPTYFVHEKLWIDMIEGRVERANYNCHFWNLMQEYVGVEAPLETNANAYDMSYKFYEGIVDQFRSTKKLFGEFLGYQIYSALCLIAGEYEPYNSLKYLHDCDFSNKRIVGRFLSEIMDLGSSESWREIIQSLNENEVPKLRASAFLEYYSVVYTWIMDDNVRKNIHVGWTKKEKCKA